MQYLLMIVHISIYMYEIWGFDLQGHGISFVSLKSFSLLDFILSRSSQSHDLC